ncbi:MAG: hypothetical protein WED87_02450 [Dehalococcoidia bacterium]
MEHPTLFAIGAILVVAACMLAIALLAALRPTLAEDSPLWAGGCGGALGFLVVIVLFVPGAILVASSFSDSLGR